MLKGIEAPQTQSRIVTDPKLTSCRGPRPFPPQAEREKQAAIKELLAQLSNEIKVRILTTM